jgi:hypothetical protein
MKMQTIKVGDTVTLKAEELRSRKLFAAETGAKAKVIAVAGPDIRVEWDRADGKAASQMNGTYDVENFELYFEPKPAPKKRKVRIKETNTKIAKLRAHFLSGRSLTQLEAIGLYGAYRLAARVHDLLGSPYAEYKLRSRRV